MQCLRLLFLPLILATVLLGWPSGGLLLTATAQDRPVPRGVTPQVDSEDEPVDSRLSIEFNRRYQDLRSGSPLSIDWTLKWHGTRLPRGHLDVHIIQGRRIRGRLLSNREIVLTDEGTRFRTLLPPFNTDNDPFSPLDIRAFFISDDGIFPLGERSLRVAGPLRRSFVVAFCEPWQQTSSPEELQFTNSLNAEPLIQAAFGQSLALMKQRLVATYPARIYPADVPTDPLWLCEYNMLVVLPDGLRGLRRNQLEAIVKWVDAGGNLCVFLDGPLASVHVQFVNRLARSTDQDPRLRLTENGLPKLTDDPARLHKGLGRVVIHQELPLEQNFRESRRWQASVSFLWNRLHANLGPTQLQSFQFPSRGSQLPPISVQPGRRPSASVESQSAVNRMTLPNEIKWRLNSVNSLFVRLTPDDFEVVPLWLLGMLLAGYVFVIGPVDYVVLGWLRLRKWTWIVFPLMTVAFTVLIIWISHEFMGTSGSARQVLFRDIGDNGELVRENRFELHLAGSHTTLATTVQRGLFTPVDHRRYLSHNQFYPSGMPSPDLALAEPAEYVGAIPTEFTAVQDLPQWSPQVNRIFRIAPDDPVPVFDWDAVTPETLATTGPVYDRFRASVHAAFGLRCAAILFHENHEALQLWNSEILLFSADTRSWQMGERRPTASNTQFSTAIQGTNFLENSCVRPTLGIFRALSRVAPHGGDNFEDLPLLDPTDPGQWLLVIAVADGDNLLLYRHLYHDRPTNARSLSIHENTVPPGPPTSSR